MPNRRTGTSSCNASSWPTGPRPTPQPENRHRNFSLDATSARNFLISLSSTRTRTSRLPFVTTTQLGNKQRKTDRTAASTQRNATSSLETRYWSATTNPRTSSRRLSSRLHAKSWIDMVTNSSSRRPTTLSSGGICTMPSAFLKKKKRRKQTKTKRRIKTSLRPQTKRQLKMLLKPQMK